MTTNRQYADIEGDFAEWKPCASHTTCPKDCTKPDMRYRVWESSDGAYEDYQYRCFNCGGSYWIDGIDS